MIQIGITLGFSGFHQPTEAGQSSNTPAATQTHATTPANTTPGAVSAQVGVPMAMAMPVYPVAMMPAFMMAQPQMMMAGAGGAAATQNAAGGHVTSNPTNSMTSSAGYSNAAGGYGAMGGYGMGGFAMPMMISPVMMQFGFPMMAYAPTTQQPPTEVVVDQVPADPAPVPPVVDDVPATPPVIDVVPPAADDAPDLPSLPITDLSADQFDRYRFVDASKRAESSLTLELKTQDGDTISLDFSQIDIQEMERFGGRTTDGQRIRGNSATEDSQRVVNMQVDGELSDAEQAAIDSVLSSVIEAVQNFFNGDTSGAVSKLKAMDFDMGQLAELSLNMSMSKSAEISKGYHKDSHVHDVLKRDADVMQALDFLASEQRRLVDVANQVLDTPSSAKLVKSLLPPLMSEPFAALAAEIDAADEEVGPDAGDSAAAADTVSADSVADPDDDTDG